MDGLDYIREAIQQFGRKAVVEVCRIEMNPATGVRDREFMLRVPAHVALEELSKPFNKRGRAWQMISPKGYKSGGVIEPITLNSLADPALKQALIDEAKQQLKAELEAAAKEEKPKRSKKSKVEDESADDGAEETTEETV